MKIVDVVFELAGSWETLKVANLLDVKVHGSATAGVGLVAESPPVETNEFRHGDLVAWWRPCPEAEAQAFEVGQNAEVDKNPRVPSRMADWINDNRHAIMAEVVRHAALVRSRLVAHVRARLAENEKAQREARSCKLAKQAVLRRAGAR